MLGEDPPLGTHGGGRTRLGSKDTVVLVPGILFVHPGELEEVKFLMVPHRGCIPDAPGETGIHLEWKQRTPLCS